MNRTKWLVLICIASVAATLLFGHFCWFKRNEHVALWLEGVALVFIFALDYINRLDDTEKHEQQHKETLDQLTLLRQQADTSTESLHLLKTQAHEQQLRELWRVLPILDDMQSQMRYWLNLLDENLWNTVNEASRIIPVDSSTVLIQAARHSNELWANVRETFRMITNADYQIARFYGQPQPHYRQERFMREAQANLRNAAPKLAEIVDIFVLFEQTERNRYVPQTKVGSDG
jgi:hypothetical protein